MGSSAAKKHMGGDVGRFVFANSTKTHTRGKFKNDGKSGWRARRPQAMKGGAPQKVPGPMKKLSPNGQILTCAL